MDRGYLRPALLWRAWHYDDEGDRWGYLTLVTEEEALAETEDLDFAEGDIPSESGTPIDEVDGFLLTEAGMRALERWHEPTLGAEGALILWARETLLPENPDLSKRRPRPIEFPLARYRDVVERMAVGSSSGTTRRGPYALLTCWA
jgi:hypothetical protein